MRPKGRPGWWPLVTSLDPSFVLGLGDLQYETGTKADFDAAFAKTWGQFGDILKPVPGNHEYGTREAAGYTSYFSEQGSAQAPTHYAWDVAGWRMYMLDSECDKIDCGQQERWFAQDLAAHPNQCTAMAMHYPRFSSGPHHSQVSVQPLWQVAYDHDVDIALAGHDHDYERFSPLGPQGKLDPERGIMEFVVGTGGKSLYSQKAVVPGSEFFQSTDFGVLSLDITQTAYSWQFVDISGKVLDSGSSNCH